MAPIDPVTYFGFQRSRKPSNSPKSSTIKNTQTTLKQSIEKSYGSGYTVTKNSNGSFTVTSKPVQYLKENDPRTKKVRAGTDKVYDTYTPHIIKVSAAGKVVEETRQAVYTKDDNGTGRRSKGVYTSKYTNYSTGVVRQYKTRGVGRYGRDVVKLSYERKTTGKTREFTVTNQRQERREIAGQVEASQGSPLSAEQVSIIKTYGAKGLERDSFSKAASKQTLSKSEFLALKAAEKDIRVSQLSAQVAAGKESEFRYGRLSEKVGRYQAFKNKPQVNTISYQVPGTVTKTNREVWKSQFKGGASFGLKTTGYIVGQPLVFGGTVIEDFGNFYDKNRIRNDPSGKSVAAVGSFLKGAGQDIKDKPGKAAFSFGLGAAIGFGIPAIKGAAGYVYKATGASKIVSASVAKFAPKVIEGGAVLGFGGVYAADVTKRVSASSTPYATLGGITSTELIPLAAGGQAGELAFTGVKNLGVRIGSKRVAAETLVDPKVLAGKQNFQTSKGGADTLKQFQANKQADGTIRTFHATTSKFGKEASARGIEAGAGSDKALGQAMKNIKSLHLEGKTVKQISTETGKHGKFVTATLKETGGLYVASKLPAFFLRIGEQPKNIRYSLTSESAGNPTALSIRVAGAKRVPSSIINEKDKLMAVSKGDVYIKQQAGKGEVIVTPRSEVRFTVEGEGVLPPGQVINRVVKSPDFVSRVKGFSEYTVVKGRAVPIYEYRVQTTKPVKVKSTPSIKDDNVYSEIRAKSSSSEKYYTSESRSVGRYVTSPYSSVSAKSSSSVKPSSYSSSVAPSSSYKFIPSLKSSVKYSRQESSVSRGSSRDYSRTGYSRGSSRDYSRTGYSRGSSTGGSFTSGSSTGRTTTTTTRLSFDDKTKHFIDPFIPTKPAITKKSFKRPESKRLFKYQPTVYSLATGTTAKLSKSKKRKQSLSGLSIRPISA